MPKNQWCLNKEHMLELNIYFMDNGMFSCLCVVLN